MNMHGGKTARERDGVRTVLQPGGWRALDSRVLTRAYSLHGVHGESARVLGLVSRDEHGGSC